MILLFVFAGAGNAWALGIRPAKSTIIYSPGIHESYFYIVNNEQKDLYLKITPAGDLSGYVNVSYSGIYIPKNQSEFRVPFTVELPVDMLPIEKGTTIMVEENNPRGSGVGANLRMGHEINVNYRYEGKYVGVTFTFEEKESDIEMAASVENLGTDDISSVKAVFDVYGSSGKVISAETPEKSLPVGEKKTLSSSVRKDVFESGRYEVMASVLYDGNRVDASKELNVGEPHVSVTKYNSFVKAGEINRFTIGVVSDWGTPLRNARAVVEAGGAGIKAETPTFVIEPRRENTVVCYVDAREAEPGDYPANLTLKYAGKSETTHFTLSILAPEEYEQYTNFIVIQNWIAVSLVLAGVMLFIFFRVLKK